MLGSAEHSRADIHVSGCDSAAETDLGGLPAQSTPFFRMVLPAVHSCISTSDGTDTEAVLVLQALQAEKDQPLPCRCSRRLHISHRSGFIDFHVPVKRRTEEQAGCKCSAMPSGPKVPVNCLRRRVCS